MTPREQEMVERVEAGEALEDVAAAMGVKPSYCAHIVDRYNLNRLGGEMTSQARAVRHATMALERALLATGKRHS